jgi:hypothetical protein
MKRQSCYQQGEIRRSKERANRRRDPDAELILDECEFVRAIQNPQMIRL